MVGKLSKRITLQRPTVTYDAEGFSTETMAAIARVWAYWEHRSGTRRWANRAAFSASTDLFVIRSISGVTLTIRDTILFDGVAYKIDDIQPVSGSDYIEITAEVMS